MSAIASFIPEYNGELHEFQIAYRDECFREVSHVATCKSLSNALKSFERAVPRHGKIFSVRKVVVK